MDHPIGPHAWRLHRSSDSPRQLATGHTKDVGYRRPAHGPFRENRDYLPAQRTEPLGSISDATVLAFQCKLVHRGGALRRLADIPLLRSANGQPIQRMCMTLQVMQPHRIRLPHIVVQLLTNVHGLALKCWMTPISED